jgi:hypothetical protein
MTKEMGINMDGLLQIIKHIAVNAVNAESPCGVYYGTVESVLPLRVKIEERLVLEESLLRLGPEALDIKTGDAVTLLRVQGGRRYVVQDIVRTAKTD